VGVVVKIWVGVAALVVEAAALAWMVGERVWALWAAAGW
jgi:hypothetical protein